MATFKSIEAPENASRFLEILEGAGGIYVPEFVGETTRYVPGQFQHVKSIWTKEFGVELARRIPLEVTIIVGVSPGRLRRAIPNSLLATVDVVHFNSPDRLRELVALGKKIYDFFSPCYGFVELPWLPSLGAVFRPDLGLPGWGWATWLGPEYDDLVKLSSVEGLLTESMPDGGRLIVCGWPSDVSIPDAFCRQTYENVVRQLDPELFQPQAASVHHITRSGSTQDLFTDVINHVLKAQHPETRRPNLPKFRYRDDSEASAADVGYRVADEERIGFEGFTRTPGVREILDRREPASVRGMPNNGFGGVVQFEGLTAEEAARLLQLLPTKHAEVSQESSPNFAEMVALGQRFPRVRFFGYRVLPGRADERICIEGFYIPGEDATPEVIAEVRELHADELKWVELEGETFLYAWWD